MTCIVCIPGDSGTWVQDNHADFARVPSVGEFIRWTDAGAHYQVKLVTHVTLPGAAQAILHAIPVDWDEMLKKAHPGVQSASLAGP